MQVAVIAKFIMVVVASSSPLVGPEHWGACCHIDSGVVVVVVRAHTWVLEVQDGQALEAMQTRPACTRMCKALENLKAAEDDAKYIRRRQNGSKTYNSRIGLKIESWEPVSPWAMDIDEVMTTAKMAQ